MKKAVAQVISGDSEAHPDTRSNIPVDGQVSALTKNYSDQQQLESKFSGLRIKRAHKSALSYVQMYGERNSGTNFLSTLISNNMKVPENFMGLKKSDVTPLGTEKFGYKHWFLKPEKFENLLVNETLFIVIYRNPYTWIRAMMERPYALSKSINAQCVRNLPDIKITGNINGKDTVNEFHPVTGEKLNLFELRKLKILNMEGVLTRVGNIAFVNMEIMLHDPSGTLNILSKAFPSIFNDELRFSDEPPRVLLEEFREPKIFAADELAAINSNICWETEAQIGYEKNNYSLSKPKELIFVILHGSSSVGKTYTLSRLLLAYSELQGIEMDDCKYWEEYDPNYDEQKIKEICPDLTSDCYTELLSIVFGRDLTGSRCIEYLLCKLQSSIKNNSNEITVVTCGALPFPAPKGGKSIYDWIERRLPIRFSHLLIEIPEDIHISRMEKRGRLHLKNEIFKNKNRRSRNKLSHHQVVSSYDEVEAFIKNMLDTKLI